MGSRVGDPEHCQSATRLQQGAPPLAGELPAAVLAAQCENGGRASTGGYDSIPSQGHGQDASAADSPAAAAAGEYAQGAPGTERPYGPETASVAAEGKEEKRHFRQSHCHDPEMNISRMPKRRGESCRARSRRTSTRRSLACPRSCTIIFCELHTSQ